MKSYIEIFYGSLSSEAGGLWKSLQSTMIDIPSIEEAKKNANEFLQTEGVEVISISHQYNEGLLSILIHYRKE